MRILSREISFLADYPDHLVHHVPAIATGHKNTIEMVMKITCLSLPPSKAFLSSLIIDKRKYFNFSSMAQSVAMKHREANINYKTLDVGKLIFHQAYASRIIKALIGRCNTTKNIFLPFHQRSSNFFHLTAAICN